MTSYQTQTGIVKSALEHRQSWEEANRGAIAEYYQTIKRMPEGYDYRAAMERAVSYMVERFDSSWSRGARAGTTRMNLWAQDMMTMVFPEDVWEFFDYPEFIDVLKRGSLADTRRYGEIRFESFSWQPFEKVFPATVYGVVDLFWFPSQFNNTRTKNSPFGISTNLLRWFIVVAPRTKLLADNLETKFISARAYTRRDVAIEQILDELRIWADNYQPRR